MPPKDQDNRGGRFNPPGFSYLYLTDKRTTALYEVKPNVKAFITICTGILIEDVEIIDFSIIQEGIFKIFGGELAPEDKLQNIAGFLLSQPVLRELEHILYTPTQIISDYIKSKGYDGICFASSVTNVGENYVFFDKKVVNFKDDASITVKINGVA